MASRIKWMVGAAAALLLLFLALRLVGPTQQGNFLAFVGSLTLVAPSFRQMRANWPFSKAVGMTPTAEALKSIQVKVSEVHVLNFVRFSWFDAIAYMVGALLLAAGFLAQVLGWSIPA